MWVGRPSDRGAPAHRYRIDGLLADARPHCFKLRFDGSKTRVLRCGSDAERSRWVRALGACVPPQRRRESLGAHVLDAGGGELSPAEGQLMRCHAQAGRRQAIWMGNGRGRW